MCWARGGHGGFLVFSYFFSFLFRLGRETGSGLFWPLTQFLHFHHFLYLFTIFFDFFITYKNQIRSNNNLKIIIILTTN